MADNLPAPSEQAGGDKRPSTQHARADEPAPRAGWLGEALPASVGGFGVTWATMFRKVLTEEYPEVKNPTAPGRAGEVRRLRAVRLGLPGRCHPRRGREQRRHPGRAGRHRTILAR